MPIHGPSDAPPLKEMAAVAADEGNMRCAHPKEALAFGTSRTLRRPAPKSPCRKSGFIDAVAETNIIDRAKTEEETMVDLFLCKLPRGGRDDVVIVCGLRSAVCG
mmetsp:Transcript_44129/g.134391  ORF Transcript_44129/g.134391 Transcript_44129/m.134391 type:complete len:105 (-) Transcript_44129:119-433(-)